MLWNRGSLRSPQYQFALITAGLAPDSAPSVSLRSTCAGGALLSSGVAFRSRLQSPPVGPGFASLTGAPAMMGLECPTASRAPAASLRDRLRRLLTRSRRHLGSPGRRSRRRVDASAASTLDGRADVGSDHGSGSPLGGSWVPSPMRVALMRWCRNIATGIDKNSADRHSHHGWFPGPARGAPSPPGRQLADGGRGHAPGSLEYPPADSGAHVPWSSPLDRGGELPAGMGGDSATESEALIRPRHPG